MRSPVAGGKERSQPQTTGYDQSQLEEQYCKIRESKLCKEQDIKVEEKECDEKYTPSYRAAQDMGNTARGLMPLSKNKNNEDSTGKNIAAVIICLLLIVRGAQGIQNLKEETLIERNPRKKTALQYSCKSKRCELGKSLKTGIG